MAFGMQEILLILVVLIVLFGVAKLPQIGEGMGKAIKNFKKSVKDVEDTIDITPEIDNNNEKVKVSEVKTETSSKKSGTKKTTKTKS